MLGFNSSPYRNHTEGKVHRTIVFSHNKILKDLDLEGDGDHTICKIKKEKGVIILRQ